MAEVQVSFGRRLESLMGPAALMWGDRLLPKAEMPYSAWEADNIGIYPAVEQIPKDIIICDWHYGVEERYPSVEYFLDKGFRVWPVTWRSAWAARSFLNYAWTAAGKLNTPERMLGMLVTGWNATAHSLRKALLGRGDYDLSQDTGGIEDIAMTLKYVMKELHNEK